MRFTHGDFPRQFGDSGFETIGRQVVELAEAVDAVVVQRGQDVHVDRQEVDGQGR